MILIYYSLILALLIIGYNLLKIALTKRRPLSKFKRLQARVIKNVKNVPDKLETSWIVNKINNFIYQKEIEDELYESVLQLKNLSMNQDEALGTEYTLELLMRFTKRSKKVYAGILSMVRRNESEQDIKDYFKQKIHNSMAEDFINIILKMDKLHPMELKEEIITYQNHLREERITKNLNKQKIRSDLSYLPITGGAVLVMFNFLMVVVWPQMFQNIF